MNIKEEPVGKNKKSRESHERVVECEYHRNTSTIWMDLIINLKRDDNGRGVKVSISFPLSGYL